MAGPTDEATTERPPRDHQRWAALAVTAIGVTLPALRMVRIGRTGGVMQYNDYWPMIGSVLDDEGGVRWRGLLESRLDHPVVIPKLTFLANLAATDGSNQGQLVLVVMLALALVGLVALLARATPGMGRWGRVAVTVASAFIVFAPMGAWSFVKAMSGTAWLSAQVLAVAAILATTHRRRWLAPGLGVLATISYGTGLGAWPAMLVTAILRDRGIRREQWPTWLAGAVTGSLYLRWALVDRVGRDSDAVSPVRILRRALAFVVGPLSEGRDLLVVAVLGALVVAALVVGRHRLDALAPWLGVLTLGSVAALLIARTRDVLDQSGEGQAMFGDGIPGRYWPVVGLIWIGLTGLGVAAANGRRWAPLVAIPLAVLCLDGAPQVLTPLRTAVGRHEALAVAMHLDVADQRRVGGGGQPMPPITDRLRAAGHIPFDGSFDLGCGLLGEEVTASPTLPDGTSGQMRVERALDIHQPMQFVGEISSEREVDCVVVVDPTGTVVGAGSAHEWSSDVWTLRALAVPDFFLSVAVRFESDGPFHSVPIDRGTGG